ncbi:TetR-like C-terminal domain-containing protein [Streptomyces sp. NPDC059224]|uniref:TetR-like C-terminal domain-containing protein n=1 Tax=Streptomyces sp. NPDC059224 TaxID=3346775 RepID=UPI0036887AF7
MEIPYDIPNSTTVAGRTARTGLWRSSPPAAETGRQISAAASACSWGTSASGRIPSRSAPRPRRPARPARTSGAGRPRRVLGPLPGRTPCREGRDDSRCGTAASRRSARPERGGPAGRAGDGRRPARREGLHGRPHGGHRRTGRGVRAHPLRLVEHEGRRPAGHLSPGRGRRSHPARLRGLRRRSAGLAAPARGVCTSDSGAAFRALLAHVRHDPASAGEFRSRCLEPRRRRDRALPERAVTAGELCAGLDPDADADQLVGPLH